MFVNNRRLAERLALRLNELAEREIARAHHGSLAREQRVLVEEDLKAGRIPCLVATSSLELGIDMGAVDLVIQVESPKSVARGLQRIGRAGHELGAVSKGRIFPKFRADLLESAVVARAMRARRDRGDADPAQPARRARAADRRDLAPTRRSRSASCTSSSAARTRSPTSRASQLENVLDMLAGRYPSDEFAELRPRIVWDRTGGTIRAREGARRLAVTNAGTIPDRGLFGVFLVDGGGRVGELDEEMVYEARAGQTFLLGASTWRIEEITRDRVLVSPAPGLPGAVPFWKGEGVGRPYELGQKIGAASRELGALGDEARDRAAARASTSLDDARRREPAHVPPRAGRRDRRRPVRPDDRRRALPRRDRRLARLHPLAVRRPRARAVGDGDRPRGCASRSASTAQSIWSDDGIALHFPDADAPPPRGRAAARPGRGRGPRRRGARRDGALRRALPRERRARAADPAPPPRPAHAALAAAAQGAVAAPGRAQLRLVPGRARDLPRVPAGRLRPARAARPAAGDPDAASSTSSRSRRASASPYSASLLFDYVATYMYEDDTPPAERRAQALSLDRDLLRELLGQEELRDLLDADAVDEVERQLARRAADRRRAARQAPAARRPAGRRVRRRRSRRRSLDERRAVVVRIAGEERLIAAEDAGRYRDALGAMPPSGLPDVFLEGGPESLRQLVLRFAKGRGPFTTAEANERFGRDVGRVLAGARARGAARPRRAAPGRDRARVVRPRRAAPAAARLARRAAPRGRAGRARGARALPAVVARRSTAARRSARRSSRSRRLRCRWRSGRPSFSRAASPSYRPEHLDALCASGEVVWIGAGLDRVALYFREDAAVLGQVAGTPRPEGEAARQRSAPRSNAARCSGSTCSTRPGSPTRRRCPRCGISSGRAR